jgi:hypothetical protein
MMEYWNTEVWDKGSGCDEDYLIDSNEIHKLEVKNGVLFHID